MPEIDWTFTGSMGYAGAGDTEGNKGKQFVKAPHEEGGRYMLLYSAMYGQS